MLTPSKLTPREWALWAENPHDPKMQRLFKEMLESTPEQMRAALGADSQGTRRALESWRMWMDRIRDAAPEDIRSMQNLYNSAIIEENAFSDLLSPDPDVREGAVARLRQGGLIHGDTIVPPEAHVESYLPPRGIVQVLVSLDENGQEQVDGLFTMHTRFEDVQGPLKELGWEEGQSYEASSSLPQSKPNVVWSADTDFARRVLEAGSRRQLAHVGVMVVRPSKAASLGQGKALMQSMLRKLHEQGITHFFGEIYVLRAVSDGRQEAELEPRIHNLPNETIQLHDGLGEKIATLQEKARVGNVEVTIDWGIWASSVASAIKW